MRRSPKSSALSIAAVGLAVVSFTACSSDGTDPVNDGDSVPPTIDGTVVPPDEIGVGGGAPTDNLDEDVNEGGIGNPQSDVDNNQPSQQDG